MNQPVFDIGIIGGGFSGAMVATHLLNRNSSHRIALFERRGEPGHGAAYGTTVPEHLLNVPAGAMSALPDEPGDFLAWLRDRDPAATPLTFAPRAVYGEYLVATLAAARERAPGRLTTIREEVIALRETEGTCELTTPAGRVRCRRVVLATGHSEPGLPFQCDPTLEAAGLVIRNPWRGGALAGLAPQSTVLLLGSGLTAADQIVEAVARGFRGHIFVVSRHGALPVAHRLPVAAVEFTALPAAGSARGLLRSVRARIRQELAAGGDWRGVIDALRPSTPALWHALGTVEQRRFLRHIRPHWDVHRHRVAATIRQQLDGLVVSGQLEIIAGRIVETRPADDGIRAVIELRGGSERREVTVNRLINCTGPATINRCSSPLTRMLLAEGIAAVDPLGIGFVTAAESRLRSATGESSQMIRVVGPMLRGTHGEHTAVRELRMQAQEVAHALLRELSSSQPTTYSS